MFRLILIFWLTIVSAAHADGLLARLNFPEPSPTDAQIAELQAGNPIVEVVRDRSERDAAGDVTAAIDINASRETLWALMLDCSRAPLFVKGLKSCAVLERSPDETSDVREHVVRWSWLAPNIRYKFYSDYDRPSTIAFQKTEGDIKILEGVWRLQALTPEKTRLWYQSRIAVGAPLPRFLIRNAVKSDTREILIAVRDNAEQIESEKSASP